MINLDGIKTVIKAYLLHETASIDTYDIISMSPFYVQYKRLNALFHSD